MTNTHTNNATAVLHNVSDTLLQRLHGESIERGINDNNAAFGFGDWVKPKGQTAPKVRDASDVQRLYTNWAKSKGLLQSEYQNDVELLEQYGDVLTFLEARNTAQRAFRRFCKQNGFTSQVKAVSGDKSHGLKINGQLVNRNGANGENMALFGGFNGKRVYGLDLTYLPSAEREAVKDTPIIREFYKLRNDVAQADNALRNAKQLLNASADNILYARMEATRLHLLSKQGFDAFIVPASRKLSRLVIASDVATRLPISYTELAFHVVIQARDATKLHLTRDKAILSGLDVSEIGTHYDTEYRHVVNGVIGFSDAESDTTRATLVTRFFSVRNLRESDFEITRKRNGLADLRLPQLQRSVPIKPISEMRTRVAALGTKQVQPENYYKESEFQRGAIAPERLLRADTLERSTLLEAVKDETALVYGVSVNMPELVNEARSILFNSETDLDTAYRNARYELQRLKFDAQRVETDCARHGEAVTIDYEALDKAVASWQREYASTEMERLQALGMTEDAAKSKRKRDKAREMQLPQTMEL